MVKFNRGPVGLSTYHVLASTALAVMLSACSSQVQRFAENPSDSDPVYTASVPPSSPVGSVHNSSSNVGDTISSRPLAGAAPNTGSNSGYSYTSAYKAPSYSAPAYRAPTYGGGNYSQAAGNLAGSANETANNAVGTAQNMANNSVNSASSYTSNYTAPARQGYNNASAAANNLNATARQATAQAAASTVKVAPGTTLFSIAKANNVSVTQLAAANNLKPPYAVSTGQVLRIPSGTTASMGSASSAVAQSTGATKATAGGQHKVANGETLFSLGRKYGVSPYAIADANGLPHDKSLVIGQNIRIPAGGSKPVLAQSKTPSTKSEVASSDDTSSGDDSQMADTPKTPEAKNSLAAEEAKTTTTSPEKPLNMAAVESDPAIVGLRWPVKGKIISDFGPKPNGMKNAGINIAVPEGTGVRAADSGVVAYSGNELKSYGNLVLIRHEGGWVTAYAHAKELFVKRGDTVKRGDVIAKAGQTGSVSSPQLHFELRKGATAVDPMKYFNSATASN